MINLRPRNFLCFTVTSLHSVALCNAVFSAPLISDYDKMFTAPEPRDSYNDFLKETEIYLALTTLKISS